MRRGWMLLDELRNGLRQNILVDIIYPPGHTDPERGSLPPLLPIGVTRPECCGAAGVLLRGNREEAAGPGEEASPPRGRRSRAGSLGIEELLESDPGSRVTLPGSPREHPAAEEQRGEYTSDGGKEEVRARRQRDLLRNPPGHWRQGDWLTPEETLLGPEVTGCIPRAPSLGHALGGDRGIATLIPMWMGNAQERKDVEKSAHHDRFVRRREKWKITC
ncbi:hypothetical protein NDU88_002627 [Pleurodeles waltl]|uniref:Uncharacterized protein n=1 Tax=Pleurodeles waltl TaxID=8319 RepID=A0AAV7WLR4_PLEWA|nr:hypothetical protein NDU88_002627 [Pleurodeles waltl]